MTNKKDRKRMAEEVFADMIDAELAELIESCGDDIECDADTTRILRSRKSKRKQQEKKSEIKELSEGSMFKKVSERQKEAVSRLKKR